MPATSILTSKQVPNTLHHYMGHQAAPIYSAKLSPHFFITLIETHTSSFTHQFEFHVNYFINMASSSHILVSLIGLFFSALIGCSLAARQLNTESTQPMVAFQYHKGPLLSGKIPMNLIWYGHFSPSQRAIVTDFISSLSSSKHEAQPSVATWWNSIGKYHRLANPKNWASLAPILGKQVMDETYTLGKSLTDKHLADLASKAGQQVNTVNIVLTASDVAVKGFCSSRCGTHGSSYVATKGSSPAKGRFTYIWVGNSETQCPGQCAWPFHQPIYGPQSPPLVAPNNDMGLDGMVINLASLLAGTVTNPYGNGYFQGPKEAPLEAASACPGIYGKGAYPGNAGSLLVDSTTGASYNANGINKRKYLLPALYDPSTSSCSTLV